MSRVRTPAEIRHGLPELPGQVADVPTTYRDTYKQLRELGTRAYDTREIIYYRKTLTQAELKNELRKYGYQIQQGQTHGLGDILKVLEDITKEIERTGAKNQTQITWIGDRTSSKSPSIPTPSGYK